MGTTVSGSRQVPDGAFWKWTAAPLCTFSARDKSSSYNGTVSRAWYCCDFFDIQRPIIGPRKKASVMLQRCRDSIFSPFLPRTKGNRLADSEHPKHQGQSRSQYHCSSQDTMLV
ncbi:hypothetical protein TgHK011_004823 [Trichoderma gracile]|nr:hypothetical protein TgHK011_004823 [Trichoderma gracile]